MGILLIFFAVAHFNLTSVTLYPFNKAAMQLSTNGVTRPRAQESCFSLGGRITNPIFPYLGDHFNEGANDLQHRTKINWFYQYAMRRGYYRAIVNIDNVD